MQNNLVSIDFQPQGEDLEYILSGEFNPNVKERRWQTISDQEAKDIYCSKEEGKVNVYVINGGQQGDEAKLKVTNKVRRIDPKITWMVTAGSTDNAGKLAWTLNEQGELVQTDLHLCPEGILDKEMKNYISRNVQVNLVNLEKEIHSFAKITGRNKLNEDYHLMVDRHANLSIPLNRANDVVCGHAMASTMAGATDSFKQAAGKRAPFLEDVLYNPEEFKKLVDGQIVEFNDRIKHDAEFNALGINDLHTLGKAMYDEEKTGESRKLKALAGKLSKREKDFFLASDPSQYLLEQYQTILSSGLFEIGDCSKKGKEHIARGEPGAIEGVQSVPLAGRVKFSKDKTAASTDSQGTINDAMLGFDNINYVRVLAFKFENTSVGGTELTMSGFIPQDALSKLKAVNSSGETTYFEKTAALDEFLTKDQINQSFQTVNDAFYQALQNNLSLKNSKVQIGGIDCEFTLAEARALLTAYKRGETGVTSKRSRICRFDDLVESGVVYDIEGNSLQVRNAIDRPLDLDQIGVITAYQVVKEGYRDYEVGDTILPGDPLLIEQKTVQHCIPVMTLMPSWDSLYTDGTSGVQEGKELRPEVCKYLSMVTAERDLMAIGVGPKTNEVVSVKEI